LKNYKFISIVLLLFWCGAGRADANLHARPRYILHAGDVIELDYRLSPEFNQTVTLEPDGHASLNIAGDVLLGGLTLAEAKSRILELVSVQLNEPQLNIVLKDFQKPYVVVGGEVETPGRIEMREDMTAMQALLLAGGPKSSAGTNKILLFRHINKDDGEVKVLNLSKMKGTSDLERDIQLEPGDMMFVTNSRFDKFTKIMKAANFGLFLNPADF
jgi:polysaccharide export outer membrane protein